MAQPRLTYTAFVFSVKRCNLVAREEVWYNPLQIQKTEV